SSLWARVIKAIHGMDESIGNIRIDWGMVFQRDYGTTRGTLKFDEMSELLQQVILSQSSDRWTWTANGSGQFFVASVRKIIDNNLCSGGDNSTRWIRCVPNKINIHAWKVMTGSLATRSLLDVKCLAFVEVD
nr:RNA-directed DNA polymerase, eukaryota [Tanacetum cinerariifolium]